jgi:peptidoglycan/LPS O-acetylase OafA/YrhL
MSKTRAILWKIGIASLWGVALVAAFATTTPKPWSLTIIGMALGCLIGHIRSRAIGAGSPARLANTLAWLCGIGLLVLAMAVAEDMFIGAWAASVAGCLLLDCVYSLPASYHKEQVSSGVAIDGT